MSASVYSHPALGQAEAFNLLHPRVQELTRSRLGWRRLRPIQKAAIEPVLSGGTDVLIISGTASGKTEAAWLPIFSRLLEHRRGGVGTLCVSPLKALINDQTRRLQRYGTDLGLAVVGWHGDVSYSVKSRVFDQPPATLIITPESLQAMRLRRAPAMRRLLRELDCVVIDEVHAFAGDDRGRQLQALLQQIEDDAGRRIPRIALSATVSEPGPVQEYLRPGDGPAVRVIRSPERGPAIDVGVHGFTREHPAVSKQAQEQAARVGQVFPVAQTADRHQLRIAAQIDRSTRGRRSLVFTVSRHGVEELTALLRDPGVTGTRFPDRFHAHHGSLSAELRHVAEEAMRSRNDAVTVCTSTLELGVDLPDIDQVSQVDTCLTIASLRQRLGRSGRAPGTRPTLQAYHTEHPEPPQSDVDGRLRARTVQGIAAITLMMVDDWVEPVDPRPLRLSVLVHQTLARLTDPAGTSAQELWERMCANGPWRTVTPAEYGDILLALAEAQLIRQDARGLLLLDEAGHRLTAKRDFFAVFTTPAEYTLRHAGRDIGTLELSHPLAVGDTVVLAGRYWQAVAVHGNGWTVDVRPTDRGPVPSYNAGPGEVHRRIRETMRLIYLDDHIPDFLDRQAGAFLAGGRAAFSQLGLGDRAIVDQGQGSMLALWTGDRQLATLIRWIRLLRPGLPVSPGIVGLQLGCPADEAARLLDELRAAPLPEPAELCEIGDLPVTGKYDDLLPPGARLADWASRCLDLPGARAALDALTAGVS